MSESEPGVHSDFRIRPGISQVPPVSDWVTSRAAGTALPGGSLCQGIRGGKRVAGEGAGRQVTSGWIAKVSYNRSLEKPSFRLPVVAVRFNGAGRFPGSTVDSDLPLDPIVGLRLSHYQVLDRLGTGGMGAVYRAEDSRLRRLVALKLLSEAFLGDPEALARFRREARAASSLNHPHICTVYDVGEHQGRPFIVMELLEGRTLREHIQGRCLSPGELVEIGLQVCQGLEEAHSQGIIHRDLKPANLFLTRGGLVKILDFGLSKLAVQSHSSEPLGSRTTLGDQDLELTRPGAAIGTLAYMSPEQALGKDLDARSDLFSLGVVFYEMATGSLPFEGATAAAFFNQLLNKSPVPVSERNPDVPEWLAQVIHKSLEKAPGFRYQSIRELKEDLQMGRPPSGARRRGVSVDQDWLGQQPSIAVLPFLNLGGDPDNEYFSDGLAEEIINALTKIPGLRVASRTSAFAFRGMPLDVRTIAEKLQVNTVLEGSVRRSNGRLRISVQLTSAADGYYLWSERYDREMKDIFAVQDEISRTIADTLKVKLVDRSSRRLVISQTRNLKAYDLYLRGRYYWNKRTPEGLNKAIEDFQAAVKEDPAYALAYAGLADSYILLAFHDRFAPRQVWPKAKEAALKALEMDDTLGAAHASLGNILAVYDWDWKGAQRKFQRAMELNPGYATAHHWYAINCLDPVGRLDEALEEIQRALALDPLSLIIRTCLAGILHDRRQHQAAIEEYRKTLELEPRFHFAYWNLARAYLATGQLEEALEAFQKAGELGFNQALVLAGIARCQAVRGRREKAQRAMGELRVLSRQGYVPAVMWATCYIGLGDLDQAFAWLEKAYEERSVWLIWLKVSPTFDPLRQDPRYHRLLRKMGLHEDPLDRPPS